MIATAKQQVSLGKTIDKLIKDAYLPDVETDYDVAIPLPIKNAFKVKGKIKS